MFNYVVPCSHFDYNTKTQHVNLKGTIVIFVGDATTPPHICEACSHSELYSDKFSSISCFDYSCNFEEHDQDSLHPRPLSLLLTKRSWFSFGYSQGRGDEWIQERIIFGDWSLNREIRVDLQRSLYHISEFFSQRGSGDGEVGVPPHLFMFSFLRFCFSIRSAFWVLV